MHSYRKSSRRKPTGTEHTLLTARGCTGYFLCSQPWSRKIPHTVQQRSLHTRTTESACCKHRSPCGYSLCSATRNPTTVRSPKPAQRERPSMTKNERVMKRKESRSVSSSPAPGRQTLVCRPMSLGSAVLQLKQQSPHTLTSNGRVRTEWGRPHGFLTASQ